ncbi:hypothetical protein HDU83_001964 [Entophlyctis luteolus]|nr:hypothetical protein HDU83_001964 [Entophlyctis luteolus]
MLFTDDEAAALQAHLIVLLEPVCDADPSVLAEYVVALLRHDRPDADLRQLCVEQLDEFLKNETEAFVSKLFEAVRSRSFMPVASPSLKRRRTSQADLSANPHPSASAVPPATASPVQPAVLQSSSAEDDAVDFAGEPEPDDDEDGRRARRRKRFGGSELGDDMDHAQINDEPGVDSANSKVSNPRGNFRQRVGGHFQQQSNWSPYVNVQGNQRGAYTNGNMRGGGSAIRPRGRCYEFDARGVCSRGDSCYFDHSPLPQVSVIPLGGQQSSFMSGPQFNSGIGNIGPYAERPDMAPFVTHPHIPLQPSFPSGFPNQFQGMGVPFRGGMGPGMGMRGGFRGGYNSRPPASSQHRNPPSTALVVENIPAEMCTLDSVNEYFKKFGTITDLRVEPEAQRATLRYSTAAEARAAHSSPEVIFGNRFVKVYFATTQPDGAPSFTSMGAAAAALPKKKVDGSNSYPVPGSVVASLQDLDGSEGQAQPTAQTQPAFSTATGAKRKQLELLKKQKEQFLAAQLETQKALLQKLENKTLTAKQKAEVMAALKSIQNLVQNALNEAKAAAAAVTSSAEGPMNGQPAEDDAATLEALKAEATAIGVDAAAVVKGGPVLRGGYNPGRGTRGGRGGYAPRSFNLDLRPKRLLIKGVKEAQKVFLMQQLKDHGTVTELTFNDNDSSLLVSYSSRYEAEKALLFGLKGENAESLPVVWFDEVGTVQISGKETGQESGMPVPEVAKASEAMNT